MSQEERKNRRGAVKGRALVKKQFEQSRDIIARAKELPLLHQFRSNYSVEEILAAVLAYSLTASPTRASEMSGVPPRTIAIWKKEGEWWDEAMAYVRKVKQDELDAKLTSIIHKIAEEIQDRLEKDPAAIAVKEMTPLVAILFDKRNILRGDPTNISRGVSDTDHKMQQLMQQFENLSSKINERLPAGRILNGEVVDNNG